MKKLATQKSKNTETANATTAKTETANPEIANAETAKATTAKATTATKKSAKTKSTTTKTATRLVAYTGIMTAMVTVATMFGFSTAEFYFNVGDTVILLTAAIFGPLPAMIAGGLGSFFADLAVYPATMLFTLFIKGLEGLLCGVLFQLIRKFVRGKALSISLSVVAMTISTLLMMTGYFVCQTFFYGTYATAIIALPTDSAQAICSTALASVLLYGFKFIKFHDKYSFEKKSNESKYERTDCADTESEANGNICKVQEETTGKQ
ncbi:MAG: ECF transporter S component [Clostridia bacterium]